MTHSSSHSPYLTILAFAEFEGDPTVRHRFAESDRRIPWGQIRLRIQPLSSRRSGVVALYQQTVLQRPESGFLGNSFNLNPVGPSMARFGIQEPVIQSRFVTQQQKPL
jgi:hypothetical protein